MTDRSRSHRVVSLADDDRARVPFAMIAALLLISSVGAIGAIEHRSEPTVDRDIELVMDRTSTAAQSELRTAVLDATHQAGGAPINTTTGSEIDAIADALDQTVAFEHYVKLLVYLEAVERLPKAGQTVGSDVESSVWIPPVSTSPGEREITPDEAIDRVDLDIGYFDADTQDGTIHATLSPVEFHVDADEPVPAETRSVSVTAGSPVFELNERMTEYETELNRGFFDSDESPDPTSADGLGQKLALRLYSMAYLKAGWNRFERTTRPENQTFEEVIDTDHTEVLANNAIFDVQEDVFGTHDPYASRTMRPQYLCMSLDIVKTAGNLSLEYDMNDVVPSDNITFTKDYENISEEDWENDTIIADNLEVDFEEELCEEGGLLHDWIFGDEATGELPEVPPLSELLQDGVESTAVADEEIEVPVDVMAEAVYIEYHIEETQSVIDHFESGMQDAVDHVEGGGGAIEDDYTELPDALTGSDDYERSPDDLIEQLYHLEVDTTTRSSQGSLPSAPSEGPGYVEIGSESLSIRDVSVTSVDHTAHRTGDSYDRSLHTISADATVDVRAERNWLQRNTSRPGPNQTTTSASKSVSVTADMGIDGSYDFNAGGEYYTRTSEFPVASNPIESDYGHYGNYTFARGFENALLETTSASSYLTREQDIEATLESDLESSSPGSLDSTAANSIQSSSSVILETDQVIPYEQYALSQSLSDELEDVHEEFLAEWNDDPYTVALSELTSGETPPGQVKAHIKAEYEDDYVDDSGTYATPAKKLEAQIRKAYFDRLYFWLDLFDEQYDDQLGALEDSLDGIGDRNGLGVLDDGLSFAQGMANADLEPDPVDLEGSPVLDDAQYEVSGSPTYMTGTSIDREQDPAIRDTDETITDVDSDVHHDPLAIQTHNRVPWPGLPVVLALPSKWYATVNTWNVSVAGEYARLEVSSTIGDPADSSRLTYVAEESPIEVELSDGERVTVGRNEAVDFETQTEVIVIMPGAVVQAGGPVPAVADGEFIREGTTYCSETWKDVGPAAESNLDQCDNE